MKRVLSEDEEWDRQARAVAIWFTRRLFRGRPVDQIASFTSVMLLLVSIFQAAVAYMNYSSSGPLADYAKRSTEASERFADSASEIKDGINAASEHLGDQATDLSNNTAESSRIASASENANQNALAADRPWLGGTGEVTGMQAGSRPNVSFTFRNFGRRPARLEENATYFNLFKELPADPDSYFPLVANNPTGIKSTLFLVPGMQTSSHYLSPLPLTEGVIRQLDNGSLKFIAFARATYRDVRTQEVHHTRLCLIYIGGEKPEGDNGFRSCDRFTDAD